MNDVDKFLSQLKAEYENQQKNTQQKINELKSTTSNKSKSSRQDSYSTMDNLLEQVKSQYQNKNKPNTSESQAREDMLANAKAEFARKQAKSQQKQTNLSSSQKSKVRENLIEQLRSDYQSKQKTARENRDLNNLKEIQQQELQRQRKRKALTRQAQEWLKNLDPRSDEGLWFEEFSYTYESKLEAAIDYLEALHESGLKG